MFCSCISTQGFLVSESHLTAITHLNNCEKKMTVPPAQIQRNIISVLIRLDREAREAKTGPNNVEEIARRGNAITWLMRKVEKDFGSNIMLKLHADASVEAGHTIGPLDASLLKDMLNMGCNVKKVHGVVRCGRK